jgi:hypothetical protein
MSILTVTTIAIFVLLLIAFVLWRRDVAETERRRWYRRFRCVQEINATIQKSYDSWADEQRKHGVPIPYQMLPVLEEVDLSGFGVSVDDWLTPEDYAKMNLDWRRFHPDTAEGYKKGEPR